MKNPYTYGQSRWMRAALEAAQESITDALNGCQLASLNQRNIYKTR